MRRILRQSISNFAKDTQCALLFDSCCAAHLHSTSSLECCNLNQIRNSRNLLPTLSYLSYLGEKLGTMDPWFISIFHTVLRTTCTCVMMPIVIFIIINFYVCMYAYSPFSPYNGITTGNVLILLFSPINDNFNFKEIINLLL
jgi:hypothetical protein